ncbi:MAG: HIT family protein [Bacteroidota bacterium]|nr:HIT family protein [Bacteroidota bacterium]
MTIFTKIIKGEIPCFKIAENEMFFAFLDINPLVQGHTLIIPKLEVDKFFDMPDDYMQQILLFARPIAKAIEKVFPCNRCGLSIVGIEVPHAHIHLIPINTADDLNFTRKKLSLTHEEMKSTQEKIVKALE